MDILSAAAVTPQFSAAVPADGHALKAQALDVLEAQRAVYLLRGRRALLRRLLEFGEATADDVRAAVELPPEINAVCLGAVPGALARAGIIEAAGFAPTLRAPAHARPVKVWRLVDRGAAEQWLEDHPEIDLPGDCRDDGPRLQTELF